MIDFHRLRTLYNERIRVLFVITGMRKLTNHKGKHVFHVLRKNKIHSIRDKDQNLLKYAGSTLPLSCGHCRNSQALVPVPLKSISIKSFSNIYSSDGFQGHPLVVCSLVELCIVSYWRVSISSGRFCQCDLLRVILANLFSLLSYRSDIGQNFTCTTIMISRTSLLFSFLS